MGRGMPGNLIEFSASADQYADSDEAARLQRDDCAQGFLDDAAPL